MADLKWTESDAPWEGQGQLIGTAYSPTIPLHATQSHYKEKQRASWQ